MAEPKKNDDRQIIIIKRIKKAEAGHHGGSWKVAYADFVTAMMAFFLLLWLLSVTTDVQKKMIATYFAPTDPRISEATSGSGGVLGGTTISEEGAMTDTTAQQAADASTAEDDDKQKKESAAEDKQDEKAFNDSEEKIQQAIQSNPDLKDLAQNVIMDMTPEGLRIQIVDQEGKPMFAIGSAAPLPPAVKLLSLIAGVIKDLPNKISVRGHTDSKKYGQDTNYTNWELSADRSNASRRVMLGAGLDTQRIENVQGKADRELLDVTHPDSARNRRISIILLKQSLVKSAQKEMERFKNRKPGRAAPETKKREEGVIYFP